MKWTFQVRYWLLILIKGLQMYQRSKLTVEKNICQLSRPWTLRFEPGWLADFFFDLQLWPLISLHPLDQNQCFVPHLKDPFQVCSETIVQGFWTTLKVCNCYSKQPFFNRAYVLRGRVFFGVSVRVDQNIKKVRKSSLKCIIMFNKTQVCSLQT